MDTELLQMALVGLEKRRGEVEKRIAAIQAQLNGSALAVVSKRVISAATRKRMAIAQRRRWRAAKKKGR